MKRRATATQMIQLSLWDSLQAAAERPETANLNQLWQTLDAALSPLSLTQQLQMAGDAVAQIAQIIQDRSLLTLEELASADQTEGPIMPIGAFSRFVRQSMRVDFEQFVEPPTRPGKSADDDSGSRSAPIEPAPSSIALEVDAAQLLETLPPEVWFNSNTLDFSTLELGLSTADLSIADLSMASSEAALTWATAIADYCHQAVLPIGWPQLRQALPLAEIELWLGLLLGEFELGRSGYQDESGVGDSSPFATQITDFDAFCTWFYSPEIWIKPLISRP
jgi:hypothetical protein